MATGTAIADMGPVTVARPIITVVTLAVAARPAMLPAVMHPVALPVMVAPVMVAPDMRRATVGLLPHKAMADPVIRKAWVHRVMVPMDRDQQVARKLHSLLYYARRIIRSAFFILRAHDAVYRCDRTIAAVTLPALFPQLFLT